MTLNFFNYFRYKRTYNTIKKSNYFDTAYYLFKYPDVRVDDIDPIKHYILNGAKERRNPSEAFDTDFYLSSYDDVHIEKINPLFHFIRFGRNEGRVAKKSYFQADSKKPFQKSEKELIVKADSRSKNDIYLSCWLRDKEHIHDVLIDLIEKLNGYGHSVVSVTHSKVLVEDKRLKSMNVAFNLVGTKLYEDENIVFEVPRRLEEELNSVFITRPIAIQKDAIKKFNIILPKAYNFWRKEFEVKSPKLVFVWGSTCEMSRLHIFLAKELNIPYLVLERGHFPKTISLETVGQYAYGGGQLLPQKISFDANFYKKYTDWVYGNTERAYSQYNQSKGISKVIHKAKQKAQKIILFIGVNDIGSGVAYQGRYNERHGNLFNASSDAFLALQKALQIVDEKALLIVKPHPVDRFDYSALENENMLYEKDSYINELIKLSDVCVTMSTTALAMVIIEQKPIVTLSLTDISGLGIAYEVDDTSSLTVKLRSALEQKNFEQKMLEGKKFITKLFSQKLFSNQDYDGLMQSTDDLAFYLSERIYRAKVIESNEERGENTLPICHFQVFETNSSHIKPIDIIIPIYSNVKLTQMCIERVLESGMDEQTRLLLINDYSPDEGMLEMLDQYASRESISVIHNEKNLGFIGSVNRGMDLSSKSDVILLNSDAIVPKNFVKRMRDGAYSDPKVATVTPFSNNAGLSSNPFKTGESLEIDDANEYVDQMDTKARESNEAVAIEVPVGHGFCIYIKRSVIKSIGHFDELSFGRGYSEEVDFCMRARIRGFVNVVIPNLFVGHIGSVSFAEESDSLKMKNREIIVNRYPEYFKEIALFMSDDPLKSYRVK